MMDKENKNCVNYSVEIVIYHYPLCNDYLPYKYSKCKYPHQKVRETQKWKENREKRLTLSGFQCDWRK